MSADDRLNRKPNPIPHKPKRTLTFTCLAENAWNLQTDGGVIKATKFVVNDWGDRAGVEITGNLGGRWGIRSKRFVLYADHRGKPNEPVPNWIVRLIRQAGWSGRIDNTRERWEAND